jgi:hypothetical protein
VAKFITIGDAETKRHKAVDFLRRIGQDDNADKFDDMTPEEYAEHKGLELIENPQLNRQDRRKHMARGKSKVELEAELDESNSYIEELEGKLDDIAGIAADEDEEEDNSDDSDEDNGNDPD